MTPRHYNILKFVAVLIVILLAALFIFPRKASSEPFVSGYMEPTIISQSKMGYGVICYTIGKTTYNGQYSTAISCVKAY
jgi:hypothetical protein